MGESDFTETLQTAVRQLYKEAIYFIVFQAEQEIMHEIGD